MDKPLPETEDPGIIGAPYECAFGFIFPSGVGVTAHSSELDFLMMAPVKPRDYLLADMLFQFSTLLLTGGASMFFAMFGLLWGMGKRSSS